MKKKEKKCYNVEKKNIPLKTSKQIPPFPTEFPLNYPHPMKNYRVLNNEVWKIGGGIFSPHGEDRDEILVQPRENEITFAC